MVQLLHRLTLKYLKLELVSSGVKWRVASNRSLDWLFQIKCIWICFSDLPTQNSPVSIINYLIMLRNVFIWKQSRNIRECFFSFFWVTFYINKVLILYFVIWQVSRFLARHVSVTVSKLTILWANVYNKNKLKLNKNEIFLLGEFYICVWDICRQRKVDTFPMSRNSVKLRAC